VDICFCFFSRKKVRQVSFPILHKQKVLISFCERKKQQRRKILSPWYVFFGLNEQLPFKRVSAMERINRRVRENVRAMERNNSRRVQKTRARVVFFSLIFVGWGRKSPLFAFLGNRAGCASRDVDSSETN
jgi:hypothetical protein